MEDGDTDLETDRLLGQQRLSEEGGTEEKVSLFFNQILVTKYLEKLLVLQ